MGEKVDAIYPIITVALEVVVAVLISTWKTNFDYFDLVKKMKQKIVENTLFCEILFSQHSHYLDHNIDALTSNSCLTGSPQTWKT